jgi:hypothetical protein
LISILPPQSERGLAYFSDLQCDQPGDSRASPAAASSASRAARALPSTIFPCARLGTFATFRLVSRQLSRRDMYRAMQGICCMQRFSTQKWPNCLEEFRSEHRSEYLSSCPSYEFKLHNNDRESACARTGDPIFGTGALVSSSGTLNHPSSFSVFAS